MKGGKKAERQHGRKKQQRGEGEQQQQRAAGGSRKQWCHQAGRGTAAGSQRAVGADWLQAPQ